MPLIKPRTRGKQFIRLVTRLERETNGVRETRVLVAMTVSAGVFPSREGTALKERNVRHAFTRMLEKADLRQLRIHDVRHSCATLLLQAGAPITYVSQQLGHADASITLRVYAHYLPDPSRKDVDLLDTQPDATQAQPEPFDDPATLAEMEELFGKDGEPKFHELEPARALGSGRWRVAPGRVTASSSAQYHIWYN